MFYRKYFTFMLELDSLLHTAICAEISKPLNVCFTLGFVHCLYNTSKIHNITHRYIQTHTHTHTHSNFQNMCIKFDFIRVCRTVSLNLQTVYISNKNAATCVVLLQVGAINLMDSISSSFAQWVIVRTMENIRGRALKQYHQ